LLAASLEGRTQAPTEKTIKAIVEDLLRTEDRNLPHVIRLLKADNALWNLVESMLDGVPLRFSRANATIATLELIGILKDQDGRCTIRNRIYQEAIHRHQIKPVQLPAANLRILSQLILTARNATSLLREVSVFLQQVLQSRTVVIFTKKSHDPNFRPSAWVGVAERLCATLVFSTGSELGEMLGKGVEPSIPDLPRSEQAQLGKISSALLIPVRLKDAPLGFLSLGEKLSGEGYDVQDREFLTAAAERVASAIQLMSLNQWKQDAESAREMQQELLPKEIPQLAGFQISGAWQPARLVSGDYYDVLKFDEHRVALCIGDVVGKGMPAALLMSNLQAAVKAFAYGRTAPMDLCEQVNRLISNNIGRGKFITFFYALVDGEARRLVYTNAGHNPPILLRPDGAVQRLDEGGPVLGMFPEWKYRQGAVELGSGDRVFLFTDGVTEVQDSEEREFGEERLIELLQQSRDLQPADLQQKVLETVAEFSQGNFHDDVTVVAMTVTRSDMSEENKLPPIVRFGPFELSVETGELYKNSLRLKLSGQPIQVLTQLVTSPGKLVTREELQQRLWPGNSFGDFEKGLNAAVNRLRDNLNDSATDPKYIETVPGRGYRFIGIVQPPARAAVDLGPAPAFQPTVSPNRSAKV
jgi:serine phosphatase RsbU (regulator of sigma subunit)/DNA-binding winged helix-turn-helix (wHTH) protein